MRVADSAILVIDAVSGIEAGTMKVARILETLGIPMLIFVTKLDKDNTDFGSLLATITEVFGDGCVPVGFPVGKEGGLSGVVNIITGEGMDGAPADVKKTAESWREKLIDAAAATDDSLIEKYLESGELSTEELASGLKKSVLERKLIPVLAGSSKKGVGIEGLLDTVSELMPSPAERGEVIGIDGKETRKPAVDDPFSALIFKSVTDPFVGQLTYFRVYSGRLTPDSEVLNVNKGQRERIAHIYELQGKEQKEVKELLPGMIGAVTKLKSAAVGDTLSDTAKKITYAGIEFPKPVVSMAVSPKAKGDEEKISNGLSRLAEEDPTLKVVRNAETKQLLIEGLGDLHLEVIVQRLKNKFNVEIDLDIPKVAYKETVTALGEGHEKHKKQSGGRGQYGEVYLKVEPMDRGAGFEFVDKIVGGVIPKNFIPAVEKGIHTAIEEGVIAGYPVVDVRAMLHFGSFHTVDSSEIAFKIAGAKAFKDAVRNAKPVLIEPIMNVAITVSSDYMGDVTGDLNSKRGKVLGMEPAGNMQTIKAQVPRAEMFRYSTEIRSMTGGRGTFEMEYSHYELVPANIAQKIIDAANKREKED